MHKNDLQHRFPALDINTLEVPPPAQEHEIGTQFALSMIIPTRNEAGNIEPLLARIDKATRGIALEVIFVDDSTDDTPEVIRSLQDRFPLRITLMHAESADFSFLNQRKSAFSSVQK